MGMGANSFLYEVTLVYNGNENDSNVSPESINIDLNIWMDDLRFYILFNTVLVISGR